MAPLAQSGPSAAPQKSLEGRRKPSFLSLFTSRTTRASTRSRLRSEVRMLYPRHCCLRGASWLRQPPKRRPESDSLFGGAGRYNRPLTATPRGGRGPSLASLVALGYSLTLVRHSIYFIISYSSIGPKGIFFTKFYSDLIKFIFSYSIIIKKVSR